MKNKYHIVFLLILTLTGNAYAQKLSKIEKKIISSVEKNNADARSFLEKVVNINSGTLNLEGVKKVGFVFKDAFDAIEYWVF